MPTRPATAFIPHHTIVLVCGHDLIRGLPEPGPRKPPQVSPGRGSSKHSSLGSSRKPSAWAIEAAHAAETSARTPEPGPPGLPDTFGQGVLYARQPASESDLAARGDSDAGADAVRAGPEDAGGPDLPFAAGAEERRAILEALEGVDGWEWDVFRPGLRQASGGRELQVRQLSPYLSLHFLSLLSLSLSPFSLLSLLLHTKF